MRFLFGILVLSIIAICAVMKVRHDFQEMVAYEVKERQLRADPLIAPLIAAGNAQCRNPLQTESYVWACGATLRINGLTQGDLCSEQDSPRYTGQLIVGDLEAGYSANWMGYFTEPLSALRQCQDEQGQIGSDCIAMTITGSQGFDAPEGQVLAAEPSDPDFTKPYVGLGSHVRWTKLHGAAVRHDFWVFLHSDLNEKPPHSCTVTAQHPRLPLTLRLEIPCHRRGQWKAILEEAFLGLDRSLVDFDAKATCDKPPAGVRFRINDFSTSEVLLLREWARNRWMTGRHAPN